MIRQLIVEGIGDSGFELVVCSSVISHSPIQ